MNRLRAWRVAHDLTLLEVADIVGVSEGMLSRLERGERGASPLTRIRIARRLGIRVSDLWDVEPLEEDAIAS